MEPGLASARSTCTSTKFSTLNLDLSQLLRTLRESLLHGFSKLNALETSEREFTPSGVPGSTGTRISYLSCILKYYRVNLVSKRWAPTPKYSTILQLCVHTRNKSTWIDTKFRSIESHPGGLPLEVLVHDIGTKCSTCTAVRRTFIHGVLYMGY